MPEPQKRILQVLSYLLPIALGLLALWLIEASKASEAPVVERLAPKTDTRLIIVWVDSLAREDLDDPSKMPRLQARMKRAGLFGPVRTCADALSVPCLTAALKGNDRFSIFALGRNFGGEKGAIDGSVIRALQHEGYRVGYFGEPMFRETLSGFDHLATEPLTDSATLELAKRDIGPERLDLALVHLMEADETAHMLTARSPEYARALLLLDTQIDSFIDTLRPTDHVLVMGDHGHTADGRHLAGLDVPTYAAYFGPSFRDSVQHPMAMTDQAAIWGRIFGLRFGNVPWVSEYFAGKREPPQAELPPLNTGGRLPLWTAALCIVLALLIAFSPKQVKKGLRARGYAILSVVIGLAATLAVGAAWQPLRDVLHDRSRWIRLLVVLITALIGGVLLSRMPSRTLRSLKGPERIITLAVSGAALFALPTLYKYGGAFVGIAWLGLSILWLALRSRKHERRRITGATLFLLLPFATVADPQVNNFAIRNFMVYDKLLPEAALPFTAALWVVMALATASRADPLPFGLAYAGALGFGFAAFLDHVPSWLFLVPCALSLPLTLLALRKPILTLPAVVTAIPAMWFFSEGKALVLGPLCAVLVLWAGLPARLPRNNHSLSAALLLVLLWMTFWTTMGCRITGVSFDFYFRWLPAGARVTSEWMPQAIFTLEKYLLPPLFGLMLALRSNPDLLRTLPRVWPIVRVRLGFVIAFLTAFALANPNAGPFLAADITQEAALWIIVLIVLSLAFALISDDAMREPPEEVVHAE